MASDSIELDEFEAFKFRACSPRHMHKQLEKYISEEEDEEQPKERRSEHKARKEEAGECEALYRKNQKYQSTSSTKPANTERMGSSIQVDRKGSSYHIDKKINTDQRGSGVNVERRGSNVALEKRGSNAYLEKRGSNAYLEKRGSNAYLEKRGSNAYLDKRGSNAYLDKRGSNFNLDRKSSNPMLNFRKGSQPIMNELALRPDSFKLGRSYSCRPRARPKRVEGVSPMRCRDRIQSLVGELNSISRHGSLTGTVPNSFMESGVEIYRVRSFTTSHKGLFNQGDSFKIRSPACRRSMLRHRHDSIVTLGLSSNPDIEDFADIISQAETWAGTDHSGAPPEEDIMEEDNSETIPFIYRVMVSGGAGVGKTALEQQFMTSDYLGNVENIPEDGADNMVSVLLDDEESILELIDASLQPQAEESLYIDAHVIVYSVIDTNSFRHAECRLKDLKAQKSKMYDPVVILVANKQDIVRNRQVSERDGLSLATRYGCKYIEVSAILNHRVDELLVGILRQIRLKPERALHDGSTTCVSGGATLSCLPRGAYNLLCNVFRKDDSATRSCENLLEV